MSYRQCTYLGPSSLPCMVNPEIHHHLPDGRISLDVPPPPPPFEPTYTEQEWRRATHGERACIVALAEAKGFMRACQENGLTVPKSSTNVDALLRLLVEGEQP